MKIAFTALKSIPLFFIFVGLFCNVLVSVSTVNWIDEISEQNKIHIFAQRDLASKDLNLIIDDLKADLPISKIQIISPNEVLRNYAQKFKNISSLMVSDKDFLDIIPQIIEITLSKKITENKNMQIEEKYSSLQGVEGVQLTNTWYESTKPFFSFIRSFSLSFTVILLLSFIVVLVHLTLSYVHSKQKDVHIQSLLGAEPDFIRKPLYAKIILQTFISGFVALIVFVLITSKLTQVKDLNIPINIDFNQVYLLCAIVFVSLTSFSGLLIRLYLSDKKLLNIKVES